MKAIDVHVHVTSLFGYERIFGKEVADYLKKYYGAEGLIEDEEEMVKKFEDLDVKALIIGWDAEAGTGVEKVANDYVAELIERYPDTFVGGWAMVDPWKGEMAVKEAERAIEELGLLGVKFQPIIQGFFPSDRKFYSLYERCVELDAPISLHTGSTGFGAGMPGGGGAKLKYAKPIPYVDDLAADFPDLTIVMIHPSWPWPEEQIAILLHKDNVYADLSGYAPQYFPEPTKREINSRLQDKFMFGSDYPDIPVDRWINEFESEGYKDEVVEKVLFKNAQRILELEI